MSTDDKASGTAAQRRRVQMQLGSGPSGSPAAQVMDRAAEAHEVKDARGRRILIKRPTVLAEYRFVEMLGESAANLTYLGMVMPLVYVASIDEDPVPTPVRKSEVEALVQRLDREGLTALVNGIKGHFGDQSEPDREAVKG